MIADSLVAGLIVLAPGEETLWLITLAAEIALAARLCAQGLAKTYRFFAALILLDAARSAVMLFVFGDPSSEGYAWTYIATTLPVSFLHVLVVLELFTLVLRSYPGIQTLSRWVISGGLAIAVLITALTLLPDFSSAEQQQLTLIYISIFERTVSSVLLLFLAVIAAFLVWYPVPLNRNTVAHTLLFGVYFSSEAILMLFRNVLGAEVIRPLSTAHMVFNALCFLCWLALLSPSGEERQVTFGHRWQPADDDRLVGQLSSLNSTLMKASERR